MKKDINQLFEGYSKGQMDMTSFEEYQTEQEIKDLKQRKGGVLVE